MNVITLDRVRAILVAFLPVLLLAFIIASSVVTQRSATVATRHAAEEAHEARVVAEAHQVALARAAEIIKGALETNQGEVAARQAAMQAMLETLLAELRGPQ